MADQDKAILYGGGGLTDRKQMQQPLKSEERHNKHRTVDDEVCFDCGMVIPKKTVKIVSQLTVSQGIKAQSFSMSIHPECYEVLGAVMAIVPVDERSLWGVGRKTLHDLWFDNTERIDHANPQLGMQLRSAFGDKHGSN